VEELVNIIQRIVREPAVLLGLLNALFGLAVIYGVHLSVDQIGAINVAVGAAIAFLRFVLTPSAEVVAQQKPGEAVKAGPAAPIETGAPVQVIPDAA
jgi:hypothetical protein